MTSTARSPLASANSARQLGPGGITRDATQDMSSGGKGVLAAIVGFLALGLLYVGVTVVGGLAGTTSINNLASGACIEDFFSTDESGYAEIYFVQTTPCEQPHAMEVYAVSDTLFAGESSYPGTDEAFAIGDSYCYGQFTSFTGETYEDSPHEMWVFVPIQNSWSQGDRKVQCLIGSFDEITLTEGTLRNAGL